jgi:pyruvate ferredoxin oxidoreductase delta subunit
MQFQSPYEAPWANSEQQLDIHTGEWRYQRPVVKKAKCRQCGWCSIFCPTGCIEIADGVFAANLEYCKGCGICSRICPAHAIMMIREKE